MFKKALSAATALLCMSRTASGAIVFLTNCLVPVYYSAYQYSEMDYYTNTPPTASYPGGTSPESKTGAIGWSGGYTNADKRVVWEGKKTCGSFSDTTFCATISSSASGTAKGTYVGSAYNGFGTQFDCYSEGGLRYLYPPSTSEYQPSCSAVYYCSSK